MKNHTAEDIIIFFIKNYASPRELEGNLMRYHRKIGTLKSCFKHDNCLCDGRDYINKSNQFQNISYIISVY